MTNHPAVPAGSNTVNSFIMTNNATELIAFVTHVFGAVDVPEARTLDTDALILHSELLVGSRSRAPSSSTSSRRSSKR